jgi:hypothetical protein
MEYPFGFEGFEDAEDREGGKDPHPTHQELQSYCERSLHSFAEVDLDEFMKIESHVSDCDSCLLAMVKARMDLLNNESAS